MPAKAESKPKSRRKPAKSGGKTGASTRTKTAAKSSPKRAPTKSAPQEKAVRSETRVQEGLVVAVSPADADSLEDILLSATYEMQDPLQTVSGFLELLLGGKVTDTNEARRLSGVVFRESMYLSHMVAELQAALLIHTGQFRMRPTPLLIDRLLEACAQPFIAAAGYRDQVLALALPEDPPSFHGDETHLRQAFTSLIDLTLHEAAHGKRLSLGAQTNQSNLMVQIALLNEKNSQEELPFPKLADCTPIRDPKQSLGLFVAHHIVSQHEGKISDLRTPEGDQRFIVILPLKSSHRSKGKVLIVEDSRHAALLVEYALQHEGYECVIAMDGLKALELVKSEIPDLIVLDVLLPGIDGFEVCHRLRAVPRTATIPIIMVSAKARDEDRSTALRVGADAYLKKPLGMAELISTIDHLTRGPLGDLQGEANGSAVSA